MPMMTAQERHEELRRFSVVLLASILPSEEFNYHEKFDKAISDAKFLQEKLDIEQSRDSRLQAIIRQRMNK